MRKDAEKRAIAFLSEVLLGTAITPRRPFKIQPMMARYGVGRLWLPVLLKANVIRKAKRRGFYDLLYNEESVDSLLLAYQKAEAEVSENRKITNAIFEADARNPSTYQSYVAGVSQNPNHENEIIELKHQVNDLIEIVNQKNKLIEELNIKLNTKDDSQPKFKIGDTLWFIYDNKIQHGIVLGIRRYGISFKYQIKCNGEELQFIESGQPPHQGRKFIFASKDDLIDDLRNG